VNRWDRTTIGSLIKLLVFLVVTALMTAAIALVIGNVSFGARTEYRAVFSDATSLVSGDDVRIAGVRVGEVKSIDVASGGSQARVTFAVDSSVTLTGATVAALRYRNMVGQRYLALSPGTTGSSAALAAHATLGLDRTSPALDLTALFAGFKPLFAALDPEQTNQLAYELIQVFQGEGSTIESLLTKTASLTGTLADRDQLIGSVITNLTAVLTSFNDRDSELSDTISTLQQLITGLAQEKDTLTGGLDPIAQLADSTAGLLDDIRDPLADDLAGLAKLSASLDTTSARTRLNNTLGVLPIKLDHLQSAVTYGSFFNFYVCEIGVRGSLPAEPSVQGWQSARSFGTTTRVKVTGKGVERCR
jgi:phospholipid/cholesterol/gamma-HCH transport system substrate-binding protein